MDGEHSGRRRNGTTTASATARSQALERLKAIRKGESRPACQIRLENPIYDTVEEDEYKDLVSKRRKEFGNFIVGDGYFDDGEEEDWTKSTAPLSSDDDDEGGEESEFGKLKKKRTKENENEKKKKVSANSAALSAAAASLMGKQKISAMFTSNVLKKRCEDKSNRGNLASDSVVEDVLAEFAADDTDRERRRRPQSRNLGLGLGFGGVVSEKQSVVSNVCRKTEDDNRNFRNDDLDLVQNVEIVNDEERKEVEIKDDLNVENKVEDVYVNGDGKVAELEGVIETKVKVEQKKEIGKVFKFNAKIKEEKGQTFSASSEWQAMNGGVGDSNVVGLEHEENPEFVVEADGSLPFYILDAYEEIYGADAGNIYLFGKVKAGNVYQSCCVVVKNIQRCVYAIPNESVFHNEVVLKLEKDLADSKISIGEFRSKLHEVASGLKSEIAKSLIDLNVSTFSMTPVKKSYAFERSDIPAGENYMLKINYPFKDPPLPPDLKGDSFGAVLGTHTRALELFLVKRKVKGPSWLSISKFSSSSNQRVSWCKFEVTVECPKEIKVSTSTKNTAEIPPVIVTAINLKTIVNEKNNANEVISASIISCSGAKIDIPMCNSEWKTRGLLSHFTVVRRLEGGIWPVGFTTEVKEKNSKATVLHYERGESELLQRLMLEMSKLDSDILVGHNISGFDLDVLLHRAQACRVPSGMWSKIGRLKRSVMPKLTKGSVAFGSGASPGIMSCIAGRLLCDTFLCSRDLLKEVSFSLTHLAKTQLNKERKEIAPHDIPGMYQTASSLFNLVECNETDAWLSMEIMFHLNILPLTRQLTNISGNLWGKTLQGARAQRVEYLLLHAFHAKKFIVPDKYSSRGKDSKESKLTKRKLGNGDDTDINDSVVENEGPNEDQGKGRKGPAYAGGLVLEPKKGLYDKYVLLLDFNSLYPSIIQEYNICFTTVERYSDGSAPRLPSFEKAGVLPELLKNLVERRKMVKSWLSRASGVKRDQFDLQQQALKLTANSMYGCLGFANSRFYAKPLAELITLQGREILQSTVDLVQNVLNLEVIYGDTDSIMIYSGLDDYEKAKVISKKVIVEVNKKYKCLEIDLDGLYKRILLLKKKKYAAVKVEKRRDGTTYEVKERKGLDIVRRDWSLVSKEVGDYCLSQILSGGSCDDVLESIHTHLLKVQEEMRNGQMGLEKFIITKSLTKPPEAYPDAKNQPHVQVALRLKQNGYTSGCSAGDTVPYIICCEQEISAGASTSIAQRARHPDELKRDNSSWMIDIEYYLSQQIHPVVSRLCASIQGTDPARLADCLGLDSSKFHSKSHQDTSNDHTSLLMSALGDEERYHGCQPLTLSCPSCSSTFDCPSIFSSLRKLTIEKPNEESDSNIWQRLRCPKCPEEGDVGRISPMMIANQIKRQADGFISLYYRGLMTCDDETCKYTTRSLNMRVIGDAERGTICPNYPHCNGRLVRKYSEVDLYKQLTYFCHILDTVRCIEKVDIKARVIPEKELDRVHPIVSPAAVVVQKLRDRCAYGWVQLNDLFVTL
ncbi:DNA polymerase alpha catalytic subunit-like isoform X1 [Silene latifolia]|uniref:DNA polymerase alpha catalytic subunit-like isoform X1 n=1 Tax=Silene latifolia TaxID=37657 RepID=UPI003D76E87B